MSHRYFGDWEADHGAQYFTARDALFKEEVAQWVEAEVAKPWSGRIVTFNHGNTVDKPSDAMRFVIHNYLSHNYRFNSMPTYRFCRFKRHYFYYTSQPNNAYPY